MKKYVCFLLMFGCADAPPYSPTEQDFDDFENWGDGISGFAPNSSGPIDTGSGGGSDDFDGIYTGSYNITVERLDLGDICTGTGSLTLAIEEGEIRVGQGSQCIMDCGISSTLRVRGNVFGDGYAEGALFEEDSLNIESVWTGVFLSGQGTGNFSDSLGSDQGSVNITGNFSVTQQ